MNDKLYFGIDQDLRRLVLQCLAYYPEDRPRLEDLEKYVLEKVQNKQYDGETDQDIIIWFMVFLPPQAPPPPREPPPDGKMDLSDDYKEGTPSDRGIQFTAINRPPPPPPAQPGGGGFIPRPPSGGVNVNTPGFINPRLLMLQQPISNGVVPMDQDTVVPATVVAGGLQSGSRHRSRDNRSASPSIESPYGYRERSPQRQRSSGI
ncbi:hypothetical protein SLS62_001572 [Diatrype stigma]|uniref:Uncharacterized protein n=1 Tax=Diatrype stigma TaxID=117547 RepID=A0AAN9UZG9_9PEZI